MSAAAGMKERALNAVRDRAVRSGKVPRKAYQHYFIEAEGLHSRIHLQNFYSTFWPQFDRPATAHVRVYGADGSVLGNTDVEIPRFGAVFLEMRDVLGGLGVEAAEGSVAVDLEAPDEVKGEFADLPDPMNVQINTPFWMAYYDAAENYMYVHSIEKLEGEVFGTVKPVAWVLERAPGEREAWRSWRLIERESLSELQVVATNNSTDAGSTRIGVFAAEDGRELWGQDVELEPRQLERVKVPVDALDQASARIRIGLDPLLTGNGKPYVLMRYADGPLSIHHG